MRRQPRGYTPNIGPPPPVSLYFTKTNMVEFWQNPYSNFHKIDALLPLTYNYMKFHITNIHTHMDLIDKSGLLYIVFRATQH